MEGLALHPREFDTCDVSRTALPPDPDPDAALAPGPDVSLLEIIGGR